MAKACRSRCRSGSRRRVEANAGGRYYLPTTHPFPARPQHHRSSLPLQQPSRPPPPPDPRQIGAQPGTRSIGTHRHPRSSHPLFAQRNGFQPDSATAHSTHMPQSAAPAPIPCVCPAQSSSRKSSPRSHTCCSSPYPLPQMQRP